MYRANRNSGAPFFRNTNDSTNIENSTRHFTPSAVFFVSFFMLA